MNSIRLRRSRLFGGVLVSALIFAAIVSLFALGVAVVATSHLSRGAVEADYASAIQLADAGINHEIRWLSQDTSTAGSRAHQMFPTNGQAGAYTYSDGNGRSYTVAVLNGGGTGPWAPPNSLLIRSTGTVNGVSRTVEITGKRGSIFGEYAIYATKEAVANGNGLHIIGNVGTNGPFTFNGNGSAETAVAGILTYNGYPNSTSGTLPPQTSGFAYASNVYWNPNPVEWPTVDEIANELFPDGGLEWLKYNNNNANTRTFGTDGVSLEASIRMAIPTGNGALSSNSFRGFAKSTYGGIDNVATIILPPGDYYFNGADFKKNAGALLVDNAGGMVRIWLTGASGKEKWEGTVEFTSTDKNKFRLYYNDCGELSWGGNLEFNGSIYAHRDGCSSSVKIHGNSVLNGSIIAQEIELDGSGSYINFPNGGAGESDDDYALFYGFLNTWREVNPSGGALFPDGTAR